MKLLKIFIKSFKEEFNKPLNWLDIIIVVYLLGFLLGIIKLLI